MSNSQLMEENIDYVLDEFDAGVPLHLTLHELHRAGYESVTMTAIKECLLLYGRITSLNQPIVATREPSAPSTVPAHPFYHNPNNSDDARTQDPLTPKPAVEVSAPRLNPHAEQAPSSAWDAEADEFAKSADTEGQTVPQIAESLCRNGYSASVAQVATSLTS